MAEDPDAIPSMQLAWEMIELARVIYKQREEVNFQIFFFEKSPLTLIGKSWKTHPEIFPKFQFPGHELNRITGKLIHQNFMSTYSIIVKYRGIS